MHVFFFSFGPVGIAVGITPFPRKNLGINTHGQLPKKILRKTLYFGPRYSLLSCRCSRLTYGSSPVTRPELAAQAVYFFVKGRRAVGSAHRAGPWELTRTTRDHGPIRCSLAASARESAAAF